MAKVWKKVSVDGQRISIEAEVRRDTARKEGESVVHAERVGQRAGVGVGRAGLVPCGCQRHVHVLRGKRDERTVGGPARIDK